MVGETAHENFQWIDNKKYTIMEFKTLHFQNSINRKCPRAIIFFPSRSRQPTNFSFNSFFCCFAVHFVKETKGRGIWLNPSSLTRSTRPQQKYRGLYNCCGKPSGPHLPVTRSQLLPIILLLPINPSLSLHRPLAQGSSFTEGQHHDTYTPHRDQITYTQTPRRSIRRERVSQKGRLLFLFF